MIMPAKKLAEQWSEEEKERVETIHAQGLSSLAESVVGELPTGGRISTLREMSNLTQQELADLMGMSRAAISDLERGKASPRLSTVRRLSEVFNVSLDFFK